MKAFTRILGTSVVRGIGAAGAVVLVAAAPMAHAGINVWTSHGPPAGDIRVLTIDPVTPGTLYAGTFGGSVFKSTDRGATWAATGLTGTFSASALAVDPATPRTLYAGTGGYDAAIGDIVHKSTDAGATWAPAAQEVTSSSQSLRSAGSFIEVSALVVDPSTPNTIYAATSYLGVLKSTDAGATWGAANAGLTNLVATALAADPRTPGLLHAGTNGGGVFSIRQIAGCIGDCRSDGTVTVDDLVAGVGIALERRELDACRPFDADGDNRVTIDELLAAVRHTLRGCPTEDPEGLSGTLFVTAFLANKVYAIDAATGDVLASADTEERPIGVEKANAKLYVANETSGTISVYDSATLSPLTVIAACHRPHHTAVAPDGSRFYAACVGTNKVAVVDTETDALVDLLTSGEAGAMTHQPWPTRDGEKLWVANFGTDDITEIDLQTGAILRAIPLGARPVEVVVSADARTAYVSTPAAGTIKVFDLQTSQLVAEPTVPAPENLILSADGRTILASYAYPRNPTAASIFDTETLTAVEVPLPGVGGSHTDLTPDARFGFVSLIGSGTPETPNGIAVVDIEAATVLTVHELPDSALPHAVRYAPGPP